MYLLVIIIYIDVIYRQRRYLSRGKANARMLRRSKRFFEILLCIPPAVARTNKSLFDLRFPITCAHYAYPFSHTSKAATYIYRTAAKSYKRNSLNNPIETIFSWFNSSSILFYQLNFIPFSTCEYMSSILNIFHNKILIELTEN